MRYAFRGCLWLAVWLGRWLTNRRPSRVYDMLARRAYPFPGHRWHTNRWGHELWLTPSRHIDRNIILLGTYDADLHCFIEATVRPGMVCVDAGANLGEVSVHLAQLAGPGGKVFAFEPVASIFEQLNMNIQRNRMQAVVRPVALALAEKSGARELAFSGDDADNQGLASIVNPGALPQRATIQCVTLDDFAGSQKLTRLDLIKIDIQGAEPLMLQGARRTLSRFSPDLLIELSPRDLRAAGYSSRSLCELIESLGYAIYCLHKGRPQRRLVVETMAADFAAGNVCCTRKKTGGAA
jgi:FkbM family methyltransferase